jgi:hypothetical protein
MRCRLRLHIYITNFHRLFESIDCLRLRPLVQYFKPVRRSRVFAPSPWHSHRSVVQILIPEYDILADPSLGSHRIILCPRSGCHRSARP